MSIFGRILVPVDDSLPSEKAIALAISIAREAGAELTFCHALDRERLAGECRSLSSGDPIPFIEKARVEGARIVASAAAEASARGLSARVELCEGSPVDMILRLAGADVDLIVMGSHGRGETWFFAGSATEELLRRSLIPVLVVYAGDVTVMHSPSQFIHDEFAVRMKGSKR